MKRAPVVMANWKMNKLPSEAIDYVATVRETVARYPQVRTILAGQAVLLEAMVRASVGTNLAIGAENVYWEARGAYTGETSPAALADMGVQYVIIGHSERRHYFRETDEMVNRKVLASLAHGLAPIIAIDEVVALVAESDQMHWLVNQVAEALKGVTADQMTQVMLAFEPTQAIGSGQAMNAALAQQCIALVRATVADIFGSVIAEQVPVLYGGSVKATNAAEILQQPDIDGVLVGDAALDPSTLMTLVELAARAKKL